MWQHKWFEHPSVSIIICSVYPDTMPQERRFEFNGTNDAYIKFLEAKVESLEERVMCLQRQQSSNPRSQKAPIPPSRKNFISLHPQSQSKIASQAVRNNHAFSGRLAGVISNFLALLPTLASQWREKRQRTSLVTPEQVMQTFHTLTRLSSPVGSTIRSRHSSNASPIDILDDYCMFASYLKQQAEQQTQLSRYATLLFLGICCVAREADVELDHVDSCIKTYLGKTTYTSGYCKRLRRASKWCAQLMERLEGFIGGHSPGLFLLYGPDVALYQKLSESPRCAEDILQKITKTLSFLRNDTIEEPAISFLMPFMLAFMGLDLQCVNKALGTNLSEEDYASRARAVESLASHDHNGQQQQGTALGGSYEPDGFQHGHIIEASVRESINGNGNDVEWMKFINWGNNTSEMDIAIAGDSSTGVL
ncbi:hypothetical protein F5B22DRAFT_587889 [Xylaria bambusicola]|uniref:uncharacterized protein n=1 Tax=Xylaria bambusicola TaxID=326684 RepID=UPI0020088590|nr:uncharacterized protein F5B22DRAFT_587889 [Xylaria bambusicola]KAI0525824.1 hypothetical protein F5B22DRAFT_587889 [Xylaria bambusicola]